MLQTDSQTLMWQKGCKIFSGKKQVIEQYAKYHPFMLTTHILIGNTNYGKSSHSTLHTWFKFIITNKSSMYYFYYQ